MILKWGGMESLNEIVANSNNPSETWPGIYLIRNLITRRPLPDFGLIRSAVPILCEALKKKRNNGILVDIIWCLEALSKDKESLNGIFSSGVVPMLVNYLRLLFIL